MMVKIDFSELYGLESIPELVQGKLGELDEGHSRLASLDAALGVETHFEHYDVRRRNEGDMIRFSTDRYREHYPHVLLLSANVKYTWSIERKTWSIRRKRRIVTALCYQPKEDGVEIRYEQSVSGIKLKQYQTVQELLGVRPHELLAAHLIARVAPVLDMYPDMNVQFPGDSRSSHSIIRERFAKSYGYDKDISSLKIYKLSPQKERVKQIFGPTSAWLEAPR